MLTIIALHALQTITTGIDLEGVGLVWKGDERHLYLRLKATNKRKEAITLYDKRFYPNHRWKLEDCNGKPVPLTEYGLMLDKEFASGSTDYMAGYVVEPGASREYDSRELDLCFPLERGKSYTLFIEYYDPYVHTPVIRIKAKPFKFTYKP